MPAPLRCPTCSAPLELPDPNASAVRCPYCGASALLTDRAGRLNAVASEPRDANAIADVLRHLRAGRTIDAVKAYREHFGGGLNDAVEAVERLAAGQRAGSSLPAPSTPQESPALAIAMSAILLAVGVAVFVGSSGDSDAAADAGGEVVVDTTPTAALGFAVPVLRFGAEGTGAGRFTDARGVAVDGAGRIYVAEYSGGRVQVFDSAGTFLTQWMVEPDPPLVDVAADRGGTVYVVQGGRIRRFEGATGRALGEVPRPDRTAAYGDVAVALDGTLWAVAGSSHLVHLSPDGAVRRSIDLKQVVDEDASPRRVAVAGTGDVYVLDRWSGAVYHLNANGRFVDRFGGGGGGAASLRSPADLAIDGRGRVYVSDPGNGIRVFDAGGNFMASFAPGVVFGLAISDRDALFAAHRNDHQIVRYRLPR